MHVAVKPVTGRTYPGSARALAALMLAAVVVVPLGAGAQDDPMAKPARQVPLATKALLLAAHQRDGLTIAVGEFGIALASRDGGESWQQGAVPVRSTLTGVYLHDAELGWAVGHDAVILRTRDGGATWQQMQYAPEEKTPLLDVWFADEDNGIAIGAYGYYFATDDGGDTWEQLDFIPKALDSAAGAVPESASGEAGDDEPLPGEDEELEEELEEELWEEEGGPLDFHLNRIVAAPGGRLYIAAEVGNVFRSDDDGASWITMTSPYDGSFFGGLALDRESVLMFGLRGHMFRSDDGGVSWEELRTGTTAALDGAVRLPDGTVIVAGLAGVLFESTDGGRSFELRQQKDRMGHTDVLASGGDAVLLVGDAGVRRRGLESLRAGGALQE